MPTRADVIAPGAHVSRSVGRVLAAVPREHDALPPASRVVLRLHYLGELTCVEIAEALALSVGR